ncbi:hypothetical protein [Maridesulfovibrio sp.]|uniref:capsular polysaccharide export protein, LipB/KpsS family n=1 Tax=Maridesulfovibrio sp. TaxID=2795000 RepID=UPI0029C9D4B8|nr:hypothetical protein [Maridesulfovibrio sp.]
MPQNKKDAVLLIGRGPLFAAYIQGLINGFSEKYEVLVVDANSPAYSGKHIRLESDYYDLVDSVDGSEVLKVEDELNLNSIYSYSNYLYYGRLAQEANLRYDIYWISRDEINRRFYSSYLYFKKIFEKYNIVFAFHDTIDHIYSFVLEAFSKKMGFGFYHTFTIPGIFNNRLLNGTTQRLTNPHFLYELTHRSQPNEEEKEFIDELLNSFAKEKPTMDYMKVRPTSYFNRYEVVSFIKNLKYLPYAYQRIKNRAYLIKKTKNFDLSAQGKYILFFFSHQPESVTTSAAQEYVDQWKIVEELAVHAPSDMNIVIKDHPFGFGWRGKDYYERLLRLPNVHMSPINYPGKDLIKNAMAVLTINGSVGLEAMMYGVKSFSLGHAWYSHPDFIPNIDSPAEVYSRLEEPDLSIDQIRQIILAALRCSVDFKVEYTPAVTRDKIESGERLAKHMMKHERFYFHRYEDIKDSVLGS